MQRDLIISAGFSPLTRRRFLSGLGMLGGASLLAACGGSSTAQPTPGSTQPPAGAAGGATTVSTQASPSASGGAAASPAVASGAGTPKRGGTLIQCLDTDPTGLNMGISSAATVHTAAAKILEGLATLDDSFAPRPELAEKWEISDDSLTYTFRLRSGIKWHDGQSFTSADVKFSILEVAAKYHPQSSSTLQRITAIETPDDLTTIVRFTEPNGPFLGVLHSTNAPMLPKHIFEGKDVLKDPHSLTDPIGTGPFLLKEWKRGDSLTLERNPNYWKQGKPYLDQIILKIIPQTSGRSPAITAGEIDYISDYMLDKADVADLEKDPNLQSKRGLGLPGNWYIMLNTSRPPLNDKRVRQALLTALDRQLIIDATLFGIGEVSKSSITPQLPWAYNPKVDLSKTYPYDPKKANQMLDDAGAAKGGSGMRFSVPLLFEAARPGHPQFAEIVRSQWGAVGVDVQLEPLELSVMLDKVYTNWDFGATLQSYTTSGDPAVGIARAYVTSAQTHRPFSNPTGYGNPQVDDLFAKAASQATPEKRAPFYFQVQEILAEDLPTLPIADTLAIDVASNKFQLEDTLWTFGLPYYGWDAVWQKS